MDERIRPRTLAVEIADRVQERIVTERLLPGATLPTEEELARQFGVSRGPVREAAKMLKQRGLVHVSAGRGMTVASPLGTGIAEQLVANLRMNRTSPAQLFEVRELLETAVCRAAAQHRTDADLRDMRRVLQEADSIPEDPTAYLKQDLGFHQALARATKNPFYALVVGAVFLLLRDPSLAPLRYSTNRRLTQAEHREILAAVESGDPDEATAACLRHLKRVRRSMEALYEREAPRSRRVPRDADSLPARGDGKKVPGTRPRRRSVSVKSRDEGPTHIAQ